MRREHLSSRKRAAVFSANGGRCHCCGALILAGEAWDVDHALPLALGGADDATNWRPAHRNCHRKKTAEEDVPRIRKAERSHLKHIGAKAPSRRPMPFGKGSPFKRKLDGTVVRRDR